MALMRSLFVLALLAACELDPPPPSFADATCTAPGQVHVLARDEPGVTAIVLDGEHVYWSSRRGPRRVSRDGGIVVDLMIRPDTGNLPSSDGPVGGLGVDASYVWFGSWGALWRVPRSGGVAQLVAGGNDNRGSMRQLVHDDEFVWWVDFTYDQLFRYPKRGPADGTYLTPFASSADEPVAIAQDGDQIWFGRNAIAKDGFGARFVDMSINPEGIAVVGDHVFWTNRTGNIARFPRSGGGARETFQTAGPLGDLIAHDGRLFFAFGGPSGGFGEIGPDGSGMNVTVVEEADGAHALAVDDEAVFLAAGAIETDIVKVCR